LNKVTASNECFSSQELPLEKKKYHFGVLCTLKCSVRDAARLKAQSEGTESNRLIAITELEDFPS